MSPRDIPLFDLLAREDNAENEKASCELGMKIARTPMRSVHSFKVHTSLKSEA